MDRENERRLAECAVRRTESMRARADERWVLAEAWLCECEAGNCDRSSTAAAVSRLARCEEACLVAELAFAAAVEYRDGLDQAVGS